MTNNGRIHNFRRSVEEQKKYKEMFVQWLNGREKIQNVQEASRENDLKGIDFFITTTDGKTHTIQLKVDFRTDETGNLPLETISQAYTWRNSVIGAEFNMEEVNLIFFLLVPSLRIWGYKFRKFLSYAIQNYKYLRNFAAVNVDENGKVIYHTLGVLVPAKKLEHLLLYEDKIIPLCK
jgi:hypothetical protein